LNPRRMYNRCQQVALRVDRDMPLAAFDLFARVVATRPPFRWSWPTANR
jgi:hypothetical protein